MISAKKRRRYDDGSPASADACADFSADVSADLVSNRLLLFGLNNLSAANYFTTPGVGGEVGTAAGFSVSLMIYLTALPTGTQIVAHCLNAGVSAGWFAQISSAALRVFFLSGTPASVGAGSAYTFTASDVGKVIVLTAQHTGAGNTVHWTVNRTKWGGDTACVGFTPAAVAHQIGQWNATQVFSSGVVLAHATHRGVATQAQIEAYHDAARVLGDLPASIGGVPMSHRWSAKDQMRGVANPAGRVTSGARGFSAANNFATAAGTGLLGSAAGHWGCWYGRLDQLATATGTRFLENIAAGANEGFTLIAEAINHGSITFREIGTGGSIASSTYTATAQDVGRPFPIVFVRTATALRLYINRQQVGADVAIAGYVPPVGRKTIIGVNETGPAPATNTTFFGAAGGDIGAPSPAQVLQLFDDIERTGRIQPIPGLTEHVWDLGGVAAVPASVGDSVGSVPLTRAGTLELAKYIETAPPAPLSLADTVTGLSADAQGRVGAPTVVVIDPSTDGRKTYGVQGFTSANALASSVPVIVGSTVDLSLDLTLYETAATSRHFINNVNPGGTTGLALIMSAANTIGVYSYAAGAVVASSVLTAADLGLKRTWRVVYTGTVWRLYKDGVQQGSDTAAAYTASPSGLYVGVQYNGTFPAANASIWRLLIAGAHDYDLTRDIEANGGPDNGVPAVVLDRVGSDHLTRLGIEVVDDGDGIKGLGPFGPADYLQVPTGGGIQGANAMHVVGDLWLTKIAGTNEVAVSTAGGAATSGYYFGVVSGALRGIIPNSGNSAAYALSASDLGKRIRFVLNKTTSVVQLWLRIGNAAAFQVGSDVAATTYATPVSPFVIGNLVAGAASNGWSSGRIETIQGGSASLTSGEIATVMADMTAPPPLVAGKTTLKYPLVGVDGKLPARVVEAVSGASADTAVRVGAPLQVAQRVERLASYEVTPVITAVESLTTTDRYETAVGAGPRLQNGGVMWMAACVTVKAQLVSATRIIYLIGGNYIQTGGANTVMTCVFQDAGGLEKTSPTCLITASDVGKRLLFIGQHDGDRVRAYWKRVEQSTGTVIVGANNYLPNTTARIGHNVYPASDLQVHGIASGLARLTLSEVQAYFDAWAAGDGRLVAIKNKTDMLINFPLVTSAPAVVLDEINPAANSVNRVGMPAFTPVYHRAMYV